MAPASTVVGGLALFLFGLRVMTDGLRESAGPRVREWLAHATRGRLRGIAFGALLGSLVHSGAAVVMLIDFANAGLVSLAQALPPVLGANVGTTLSMQLASFRLPDYGPLAVAVGFLFLIQPWREWFRNAGLALVGLGLLFVGMRVMGDAIRPLQGALAPIMARIDGRSATGLLSALLMSAAVTVVIQSSGGTIGMGFALISAGAIERFEQVFPIVLGAHIGTCATAFVGSVGANVTARRIAFAHLAFNIAAVVLALCSAPVWYRIVPATARDLVHQTANFHTLLSALAAVLALPFSRAFAAALRRGIAPREPEPQPSFLDETVLDAPERALALSILELQRVARICHQSLRLVFDPHRESIRAVRENEKVIDEVKRAVNRYLRKMTKQRLSTRQTILIQHLDRCMSDIERIGDHIDAVHVLSAERRSRGEPPFTHLSIDLLLQVYEAADRVLALVVRSLDPEQNDFQTTAAAVLAARDDYVVTSVKVRHTFMEKVENRQYPPLAGLYFHEYVRAFDRIVRHAKSIALAEQHPDFWVQHTGLPSVAPRAPVTALPPPTDRRDDLGRLQMENYL